MLPASGFCRIPKETAFFPVHFHSGLHRNRREIYPEHGSSIPVGNYPKPEPSFSQIFLCREFERNVFISGRTTTGTWPYPFRTTTEPPRFRVTNDLDKYIDFSWLKNPLKHSIVRARFLTTQKSAQTLNPERRIFRGVFVDWKFNYCCQYPSMTLTHCSTWFRFRFSNHQRSL